MNVDFKYKLVRQGNTKIFWAPPYGIWILEPNSLFWTISHYIRCFLARSQRFWGPVFLEYSSIFIIHDGEFAKSGIFGNSLRTCKKYVLDCFSFLTGLPGHLITALHTFFGSLDFVKLMCIIYQYSYIAVSIYHTVEPLEFEFQENDIFL